MPDNSRPSSSRIPGRILFVVYLVLLAWLPLPFGSNHAWAWSIMEFGSYAISIAWLICYLLGKVYLTDSFRRSWPITAALGVVTGWVCLQAMPLPAALTGFLSPGAYQLHAATSTGMTLSLDPASTQQAALKSIAYLCFFCMTLLLVDGRKRCRLLMTVLVVSGVFQAAYGSIMTLSGIDYGFFVEKEYYRSVVTGTFVNRNHLAGYLVMALAMGTGLMIADLSGRSGSTLRARARRLFRFILSRTFQIRLAIVVMVIGLVLTQSRMGNAAFFISLTCIGTYYLVVVRKKARTALIFFASVVVIDLVIVSNFFGIAEVTERIQQTRLDEEMRDEVVRDSVNIVKDFPATGTGAGSFASVFPMYDSGAVGFVFYRHAHSDYVQFAVEFGLLALVLLAIVVIRCLWLAMKALRIRNDKLMQGVGFGASLGIVAILIHSLVDFNLQIPANAALFVVILALGPIALYWDPRSRIAQSLG